MLWTFGYTRRARPCLVGPDSCDCLVGPDPCLKQKEHLLLAGARGNAQRLLPTSTLTPFLPESAMGEVPRKNVRESRF